MAWTFNSEQPIYMQITEIIKTKILSGEYAPGTRIPSIRDLALEAGVNPNTMQKAFLELEQIGLVVTNRTAGRCVTEDDDIIRALRIETATTIASQTILRLQELGLDDTQIFSIIEKKIAKERRESDE